MRDFDGTDDRINFGSPDQLDDLTVLSVACWFRPDAAINQFDLLICKGQGAAVTEGQWGVSYTTFTGDLQRVQFYRTYTGADPGDEGEWGSPGGSFPRGTLHHCLVTHDGSLSTNDPVIYKNGVSQAITETKQPQGSLRSDATQSLILGETPSGGGDFDGLLGEVAIWNAVLDDAEANSLGKGISPLLVRPGALVFYAPLLGNESPEQDIVGGASGTVTGATKADHPRIYRPGRPKAFAA